MISEADMRRHGEAAFGGLAHAVRLSGWTTLHIRGGSRHTVFKKQRLWQRGRERRCALAIMRSALVERLASATAISKQDAAAVLSTVLDAVAQALCRGDRIELRDFGVFSTHQHQAREARNPRTGELVSVPARKSVHFKGGRQLLRALNGDEKALAALRKKQDEQRQRRDEKNGQLSLF